MIIDYARSELDRIPKDEDGIQTSMNNAIMELVELILDQEHSGISEKYAGEAVHRIMRIKPLTWLTGEVDEWTEAGPGLFQNKRCPSVFKDASGKAYDTEAIRQSLDGKTWVPVRKEISFPYWPPTEPERQRVKMIQTQDTEDVLNGGTCTHRGPMHPNAGSYVQNHRG